MVEDRFQLFADKSLVRQLSQDPQRKCVFHVVTHQSAPGNRLERVPMPPDGVRAFELRIDKAPRILHLGDLRDPRQRYSQQGANGVGDALANVDGTVRKRRPDHEAHLLGCNAREITRGAEKLPGIPDGNGQ